MLLPIITLGIYYNQLAAEVPTHFNISGEADDWTKKENLWYIMLGLPLFMYLLFKFIPRFDPKNKIKNMGSKYFTIQVTTSALITALCLFMIFSGVYESISFSRYGHFLLLIFLAVLGNYMQSLKPNYFIGVRTPWTLEDPDNWRKTHRLTSRLWMFGCLILFIIAVTIPMYGAKISIWGITILALIPIAYSFWLHTNKKKQEA